MIDLRGFVATVLAIVARHACGPPGEFARYGGEGTTADPYGCADAANLLYTAGHFPPPGVRSDCVTALRALQNADTGLFTEPTHHPLHTTAHVCAALELFDARPIHPMVELAPLQQPERVDQFLDGLDWTWNPWGESHKGAGLYAIGVLTGTATTEWQGRYFDWLWREADPDTGLWRRGCLEIGGDAMLFHHLAGSFHYLFNYEHARRPLRFPARMVDSCLRIARDHLFPPLGRTVGYAELDWIYCLHRSMQQSGHRTTESRTALHEFAERYVEYLVGLDPDADPGLNDLHQLLGAVSALAELQRALPGLLATDPPLRLVLDRRPFI